MGLFLAKPAGCGRPLLQNAAISPLSRPINARRAALVPGHLAASVVCSRFAYDPRRPGFPRSKWQKELS